MIFAAQCVIACPAEAQSASQTLPALDFEQAVATAFDVAGHIEHFRVLPDFRGRVGTARQIAEIDVSNLTPGLYLIQVRGETFADVRRLVVL